MNELLFSKAGATHASHGVLRIPSEDNFCQLDYCFKAFEGLVELPQVEFRFPTTPPAACMMAFSMASDFAFCCSEVSSTSSGAGASSDGLVLGVGSSGLGCHLRDVDDTGSAGTSLGAAFGVGDNGFEIAGADSAIALGVAGSTSADGFTRFSAPFSAWQ